MHPLSPNFQRSKLLLDLCLLSAGMKGVATIAQSRCLFDVISFSQWALVVLETHQV